MAKAVKGAPRGGAREKKNSADIISSVTTQGTGQKSQGQDLKAVETKSKHTELNEDVSQTLERDSHDQQEGSRKRKVAASGTSGEENDDTDDDGDAGAGNSRGRGKGRGGAAAARGRGRGRAGGRGQGSGPAEASVKGAVAGNEDEQCSRREKWIAHLERKHVQWVKKFGPESGWSLPCPWPGCDSKLPEKKTLLPHMYLHMPEETLRKIKGSHGAISDEYKCPYPWDTDGAVCGKVFQQINGLQYHMANGHVEKALPETAHSETAHSEKGRPEKARPVRRKRKGLVLYGPITQQQAARENMSVMKSQGAKEEFNDDGSAPSDREVSNADDGERANKQKGRTIVLGPFTARDGQDIVWQTVNINTGYDEKDMSAVVSLYGGPPLFPSWRPSSDKRKVITGREAETYYPRAKQSPWFAYANENAPANGRRRINRFGTSELLGDGDFLLNCGGPIWGLAWCPSIQDQRQYLAVSTHASADDTFSLNEVYEGKGCIQVWDMGDMSQEPTAPRLSLVIVHKYSHVRDLKWCPTGVRDNNTGKASNERLGLLAAVFGDGVTRVYAVPYPSASDAYETVLLEPEVTLQVPGYDSLGICCDWQRHAACQRLVVGCFDGAIAIFDLASAEAARDKIPEPIQCISTSSEPILTISTTAHGPYVCSGTMFGELMIHDVARGVYGVTHKTRLFRGSITSVAWESPHELVVALEDGLVKRIPLGPNRRSERMRTTAIHRGCVWDISYSAPEGACFSCGEDGALHVSTGYGNHYWTRSTSHYKKRPEMAICRFEDADNGLLIIRDESRPHPNKEKLARVTHISQDVKHKPNQQKLSFPSLNVSLHKVRHNPNDGLHAWIAFGGRAGLLRVYKPAVEAD